MGEKQEDPFQLSFNTSLKVDFQGSRVTSDGGLIVVRRRMSAVAPGERRLLLPACARFFRRLLPLAAIH